MRVVALLQNAWMRDAERAERIFARHAGDPERRAKLVAAYLFFGGHTGRRIYDAFGEEVRHSFVWENASPKLGRQSSDHFPPDPEHIRRVLDHFKPKVVLTLGAVPAKGVADTRRLYSMAGMWSDFTVVSGPHPAGRAPDVMDRLRACAAKVKELTDGQG